jgi:2'-5' RNA ligase
VKTAKPLELTINRVGYTPPDARSRMVWLYLNKSKEFNCLGESVLQSVNSDAGLSVSFYRTDASISPHVTLARFRADVVLPDVLPNLYPTGLEGKIVPVQELILFESPIEKQRTGYKVLDSVALY